MSTWSCDQQVCASCRYWCGRREIDVEAYFFTAYGNSGKCANLDSGFRNTKTDEGGYCSQWEAFNKR